MGNKMSEEKVDGVVNVTYNDFVKTDIRIATVLDVCNHADPKVDKLLVLTVKVGEENRQIVAGIKKHYTAEQLIGTQIVIVANLEPRMIRGEMSHGMLLAASDSNGNLSLIRPDKPFLSGSQVK